METQKEIINRILSMKYGRTYPAAKCKKHILSIYIQVISGCLIASEPALNIFIREARIRVVQAPITPPKKSRRGENPSLDLSGKRGKNIHQQSEEKHGYPNCFPAKPHVLLCCAVDTLGSKNMVNLALLLRSLQVAASFLSEAVVAFLYSSRRRR